MVNLRKPNDYASLGSSSTFESFLDDSGDVDSGGAGSGDLDVWKKNPFFIEIT